jgi:hypothetical protein
MTDLLFLFLILLAVAASYVFLVGIDRLMKG